MYIHTSIHVKNENKRIILSLAFPHFFILYTHIHPLCKYLSKTLATYVCVHSLAHTHTIKSYTKVWENCQGNKLLTLPTIWVFYNWGKIAAIDLA